MFTLLLFTCVCILSSHNANARDFQLPINSVTEMSNPIAFDNKHFLQFLPQIEKNDIFFILYDQVKFRVLLFR